MFCQIVLGPHFKKITFQCCFLTCHWPQKMLTVKLILYNLFYACDSVEPNPHFFKVKNKEKL